MLLYASVAQWIEHWPPKPVVAGSIPARRANSPLVLLSLQRLKRSFLEFLTLTTI